MLSNFAVIKDGIVVNIIVGNYTESSISAKRIYGDDAEIVEVWSLYYPPNVQIPVNINDVYENGVFSRNGELVNAIDLPTTRIDEMSSAIDALILAITPTGE